MKCAQATIAVPYSNSTRRGGGGVGGGVKMLQTVSLVIEIKAFLSQPNSQVNHCIWSMCVAICVKFTQPVSIQLDCPNQIFILKPNFEIVLFPVST